MAERTDLARRLRTDLIWISGLAKLADWRKRGRSALIGFDRVRLAQRGAFQPRRDLDVVPAKLDRVIRALKHWRVDVVSIDEACARLAEQTPHRFVSLSFNGSYRDVMTSARPVLTTHDVPYTVYVPSAFPDGIAEPWWLALELAIATHERVSLMIDRDERHFVVADADRKMQLYDYLYHLMRRMPAADLDHAIKDLCARYGVDMAAVSRDIALTWDDVATLAADPRVTIGSATVNYPVLATLDDEAARRDIMMGRAVLETALQRPVRHFAFPFGDRMSFKPRDVDLAQAARFASAVTTVPGTLNGQSAALLPRLVWSDRMTIRSLRVRLAGY